MSPDYYQTLRLKIIAVTLCFSLVPLVAVGVAIHYQYDTAYDRKVMEVDGTIVHNRRIAVELFLAGCVDQLRIIAKTHSLEQLKDQAYLKKVFNTMQSDSRQFIDLSVIDDQGNHLCYVGPYQQKLRSVNYSDQDWFQAAMASHVYVSDVFLGFRQIPHIIIAVGHSDEKKGWILRTTINSDVIATILRQGYLGSKDDVFIINKENILQTGSRLSGQIMTRPNTPDFSSSVGTRVEKIDFQGEETIFATSEMVYPKWIVVVKDNVAEELEPLFMAQRVVILVLGWVLYLYS